jgi:phage-related protein
MRYFQTRFLPEAEAFLERLDRKAVKKVLYTIDLAEQTNDPKLVKKVTSDLWEFRILWEGMHYRFLAFWDKQGVQPALVIATHGFVKKSSKIPVRELERAIRIRKGYFEGTSIH